MFTDQLLKNNLRSLGEQNNILTLPIIEGQLPADICRRAVSAAILNGAEIILFDTAGRTQIDLQMMSEIKQIEKYNQSNRNIFSCRFFNRASCCRSCKRI